MRRPGCAAIALIVALGAASCASDPNPCDSAEPGYLCMVAGTGAYGFNEDGLAPEDSDLYLVSQARRGPDGLLYVMDFNNHRLRVIDEDGRMQTLAGNGFHGPGFPGVIATDSPLENPIDFDFLPNGRPVIVSYHDPRLLVLTAEGTLESIAGTGDVGETGSEGDGNFALFARFIQLDGIAVAPDGAIYVSDSLAHRIRVIRENKVSTFAGTGDASYSGDGGPATEAALNGPTALALGNDGDLYVADTFNNVVRHILADGTIETVAGTGEEGFAGDTGPAIDALLNQPTGVDIAADGTIYVADRNNFRVRRIDPSGTIETLAGTGINGDAGRSALASDAALGFVARVTLDGDSLLVSDQSNSCVRRLYLPNTETFR